MARNRFIYATILIMTLIFSSCDTYSTRKKLVVELSSLFNDNRAEFDMIEKYFVSDSLFKVLEFRYQDEKIGIDIGNDFIRIDHISQIKENPTVYEILTFMRKKGIRSIYGNGYNKDSWITISFEDNKFPCFNFLYRSDFNPNDENVKQQIENFRDSSKKSWIHVLDEKGWYIKGVPCFS